jgi:hypothetical protein
LGLIKDAFAVQSSAFQARSAAELAKMEKAKSQGLSRSFPWK